MVFDFYTKKIKVFISEVTEDVTELKDRLVKVINRAGMEVLCLNLGSITTSEELKAENEKLLKQADCSVHIIGNQIDIDASGLSEISIVEYQLREAQKRKNSEWKELKIFIWYPAFIMEKKINANQDDFISSLRQEIMHNMIYSNRNSVVSFVEDIRSVMYGGKPEEFDVDNADIFFIYNSIDNESAIDILTLVADVANVKTLEIILSEEVDYAELVSQQVDKSKLVVIYYKNAAAWALPFIQQVWKKVGGASSPAEFLFIGDANIPSNMSIEFEAPKVTSQVVVQEIIPIEIKVQFDRIKEE